VTSIPDERLFANNTTTKIAPVASSKERLMRRECGALLLLSELQWRSAGGERAGQLNTDSRKSQSMQSTAVVVGVCEREA
jgi:hypothetical protein